MFTAVIPVKKKSSRFPGKNLKQFGNENLLSRKISQLKRSAIVDRIIVSSDCIKMLKIAKEYNVEGIRRPQELANETKPLSDFFSYIVTLIPKGHLVWSCVTSPHFDERLMIKAKKLYLNALKQNYDSLITVYKFQHYLMDKKGPLNYKLGRGHLNSENLPKFDLFTNGILMAPIKCVKKWKYNYGPKAFRFEVNQKAAVDIDTKYDYYAALAWSKLK